MQEEDGKFSLRPYETIVLYSTGRINPVKTAATFNGHCKNRRKETKMKTFQYVIKDEVGIHARPAGLLVKEVKEVSSPR